MPRARRVAAGLAVGWTLLFVAVGASAFANVNDFAATADPGVVDYPSTAIDVTVTNLGIDSQSAAIGCVRISVPGAVRVLGEAIVQVPAGKTWVVSTSTGDPAVVTAHGATNADWLAGGAAQESVGIGVTARPTANGTTTWTVTVYRTKNCTTPSAQVVGLKLGLTGAPGPTPTPTPKPTPSPAPTAAPTPTPVPTPTPMPTRTPTPTAAPTPTPTAAPTATGTPTPRPTTSPVPGSTGTPTSRPTATPTPTSGTAPTGAPSSGVTPTPVAVPGASGGSSDPAASGSPSATSSGDPASSQEPSAFAGFTDAPGSTGGATGSGGAPIAGADRGAGLAPEVFTVGGTGSGTSEGVSLRASTAELTARILGVDWAVPSVILGLPGVIVALVIAAQVTGGAAWLPVVRRNLGSFGLPTLRRRA